MSQCFSGRSADAMTPLILALPSGDVCAFYSRPARPTGVRVLPEGRDRDRMGHRFRFIEAMGRHGALDDAHDAVLLLDTSPDVPIRTSDLYLERLLSREAEAGREAVRRSRSTEKLALASEGPSALGAADPAHGPDRRGLRIPEPARRLRS